MDGSVVTANRLSDGLVVFLAAEGWVASLDEAAVATAKDDLAALEAKGRESEARNEVVGAYSIEIRRTPAGLVPVRYREWLRTAGPSVRTDLGYQAERAA
ncbi:MAG: DUF2849 domain-containing protein [Geminicoccaceae bacterium]